ncbi:hypothetical protein WJX84_002013 [Apatococcus fuscideae]|uniref:Uncharacterized protein n=1 Tax=Apatococcus fuscideae TaxID=2026836 RepID=A0AAW1SP48_9CHLO
MPRARINDKLKADRPREGPARTVKSWLGVLVAGSLFPAANLLKRLQILDTGTLKSRNGQEGEVVYGEDRPVKLPLKEATCW